MDKSGLAKFIIGDSLDQLMNIDPRGYGVSKILYDAARAHAGEPLAMLAAEKLRAAVRKGDTVFILTGFVLLPHKKAETDGFVGAMLLARALVAALGARPVLICPDECLEAAAGLAPVVGLHTYASPDIVNEYPYSMNVYSFTKDRAAAPGMADDLIARIPPAAVIAIECPGANRIGVYHNSAGMDVSNLEAKSDVLFEKIKAFGAPTFAIGDLGNETGMAAICDHIRRYIPHAADISGVDKCESKHSCVCGCGGGIAAATAADHLITATVSDWGCYALISSLAYLCRDYRIMHDHEMQREAMIAAPKFGLVDMTGRLEPSIDGFGPAYTTSLVTLMRECIKDSLMNEGRRAALFEKTLGRGYFKPQ